MNLHFVKSNEKKRLLAELKDKYGIDELRYLLMETGKEKVRGFSGSMTKEEIIELGQIANVEIIGLYLFKKEQGGLRLSLDGSGVLGEQISKNIFDIKNDELESWMRGNNLEINLTKGIFVVKSGYDFFGCGISDGKKLINFVPKERRIRSKN